MAKRRRAKTWDVSVEGAEEVVKMLEDMGDAAKGILDEAAKAAAEIVLSDAKQRVPVKTGKLKRALAIKQEKTRKNSKASYQVGPKYASRKNPDGVNYGHLVEYGYKRKDGKIVPAEPYLRPALDNNKSKIEQVINDSVRKSLEAID